MVAFGTRPEAIKLAPLIQALRHTGRYCVRVVVTAQHREMLDQVLETFAIVPDEDLDLFEPGQTLDHVMSRSLTGLQRLVEDETFDLVLVQGDTTTTFAAALSAFYAGVPVGHVEAGLRTGDVGRPFPEEMNRRLTSQLATLHFAPTSTASRNLLSEGVDPGHIFITGNTGIDALRWALEQPTALRAQIDPDGPLLLVTAHRRESWGVGLAAVGEAIARLAAQRAGLHVVLPIHPNPIVRRAICPWVAAPENVHVVEPLPYGEFVHLMRRATVILTDSGGIQEEAPSLGVPVLVLRDVTERSEAVDEGTARLVGLDPSRIEREVGRLLDDPDAREAMARTTSAYGDGRACERIVAAVDYFFEGGTRPHPAPSSRPRRGRSASA
jgi:UDP-N-acetylglucosamine 2-epimerase (non-hydrolysing)